MCLLTFYPPGREPSPEDITRLHNGALYNDDGHGFAIVDGNEIIVRRGLDADTMIDWFAETRHQHPIGPALFHSRMATHGVGVKWTDPNKIKNVHPFHVGRDSRIVVAHNGILPQEVHPQGNDPRSDTRIFAEDWLPFRDWANPRSRKGRKRLATWMGRYNKVVILTVHPKWPRQWYIVNEREGVWRNGIWYSNFGYSLNYYGGYNSGSTVSSGILGDISKWDDEDWQWVYEQEKRRRETTERDPDCDFCGAFECVNRTMQICRLCLTCQDCSSGPEDCQCFTPEDARKALGDDPSTLDARTFISERGGKLYLAN